MKSKIHLAKITSSELHYQGSIAIGPELLEAAGLLPGEKVHVLNFDNGNRFETYTIAGKRGEIGLRGPAARLGKVGEKVVIIAYAQLTQEEANDFNPQIVFVDDENAIKD